MRASSIWRRAMSPSTLRASTSRSRGTPATIATRASSSCAISCGRSCSVFATRRSAPEDLGVGVTQAREHLEREIVERLLVVLREPGERALLDLRPNLLHRLARLLATRRQVGPRDTRVLRIAAPDEEALLLEAGDHLRERRRLDGESLEDLGLREPVLA